MNAHFGPTIRLNTHHGDFDVAHVTVQDSGASSGFIIREGVVLKGLTRILPIPLRVQSSCLFSESFWATDCDCALQLRAALERVASSGGVVLYFYEEGRGAGLAAKFKAIELQQAHDMDTRAAYECLKMSVDARTYGAAAEVLRPFVGHEPVIVLTNNPGKTKGLLDNGINVVSTENLVVGLDSPAIAKYLREKVRILGHKIPGVL